MNTLCSNRLPVTALRPRRASRCFGLAVSVLAAGWLTAGHAVADTIVYTSLASQTDGFQTNGGATAANGSTTLLADDITFASGAANQIVNSFIIGGEKRLVLVDTHHRHQQFQRGRELGHRHRGVLRHERHQRRAWHAARQRIHGE